MFSCRVDVWRYFNLDIDLMQSTVNTSSICSNIIVGVPRRTRSRRVPKTNEEWRFLPRNGTKDSFLPKHLAIVNLFEGLFLVGTFFAAWPALGHS